MLEHTYSPSITSESKEAHLEWLQSLYDEDPDLLLCTQCFFPPEYHTLLVGHNPRNWPAEHAIRLLKVQD